MTACLKRAEHADHKGVLSKGQDVPLHERLLDLIPQEQVLFVDLLHGKALPRLSVSDQIHSSMIQTRGRDPYLHDSFA